LLNADEKTQTSNLIHETAPHSSELQLIQADCEQISICWRHKKPVFEKNTVLRLFDRDFGLKKPVFEKKYRFTAFWPGFRSQKAGFRKKIPFYGFL